MVVSFLVWFNMFSLWFRSNEEPPRSIDPNSMSPGPLYPWYPSVPHFLVSFLTLLIHYMVPLVNVVNDEEARVHCGIDSSTNIAADQAMCMMSTRGGICYCDNLEGSYRGPKCCVWFW